MPQAEWEALSPTQQDLVERRANSTPFPADDCPICAFAADADGGVVCGQHDSAGRAG